MGCHSKLTNATTKTYKFIVDLLIEEIGFKGQIFFPFFFIFFTFIIISNLSGLVPFHHTATSHFIVAFSFSLSFFLGLWFLGFFIHKLHFFSLFFPFGSPILLAPLIVIIEIVSFFSRPISLAVRLCANMISGHVLIKILCNFSWLLIVEGLVFAILPVFILTILSFLETGIALLQSYVVTVLVIIYLKESLFLH